jgi:hypothetical protein
MQTQKSNYKTADLYYAAYLAVAGVSFIETTCVAEKGKKQVFFWFESTDMLKDLKRDYFNRKGKVSALQYADEVRSYKNLTHEAMANA